MPNRLFPGAPHGAVTTHAGRPLIQRDPYSKEEFMAKELIRRSNGLGARRTSALSRDLIAVQRPAKLAAARIQAAAFTAHTGLICTEVVTAAEVQAVSRQGAVLDARAKAIGDTYAGLVTTELARLALEV